MRNEKNRRKNEKNSFITWNYDINDNMRKEGDFREWSDKWKQGIEYLYMDIFYSLRSYRGFSERNGNKS